MDIDEPIQSDPALDSARKERITRDLSTNQLPEMAQHTDELSLKDFLVLVVDDSIDNVLLMSIDLQEQGYRVITAADGQQGVHVASQTRPDMILMDIGMPELDGLAAARKIREDSALRNVPIIAVTAFDTEGFKVAARDAGFDAYLRKPIDLDRLHELMRRLLPMRP